MPRLYVRDFRPKGLFLFYSGFDGFRSDGLNLNGLRGNAGDDVVGRNILRRDAHRTDHAVLADVHTAHDSRVIGDAGTRSDLALTIGNDHAVVQIVVV